MQRETYLLSELDMEEPGLVMHFLKHLSVTFCRSSCMLDSATCCYTCWMIFCSCWGGSMGLGIHDECLIMSETLQKICTYKIITF